MMFLSSSIDLRRSAGLGISIFFATMVSTPGQESKTHTRKKSPEMHAFWRPRKDNLTMIVSKLSINGSIEGRGGTNNRRSAIREEDVKTNVSRRYRQVGI